MGHCRLPGSSHRKGDLHLGDGGFLYSAMELETAVRLKCNLVHLVWIDGAYDMSDFKRSRSMGAHLA